MSILLAGDKLAILGHKRVTGGGGGGAAGDSDGNDDNSGNKSSQLFMS